MRLLIVSAYGPAVNGGVERATRHLAEGLAGGGASVHWACAGGAAGVSGVESVPLPSNDWLYRRVGVPMPIPSLRALRRLMREARAAEVVLVADAYYAATVFAAVAAKLSGRRLAVVQHVGRPSARGSVSAALFAILERLIVRPVLKRADAVVFVSRSVAAHFSGLLSSAPVVIGHGVDDAVFFPANREGGSERRQNLYVGRFTATKGLPTLRRLASRRPQDDFLLIGDGPIDPAAWNLPNVRVEAATSPALVAEAMRRADRFVLPSASESFSLVVREALACGLPVVCGKTIIEADPDIAGHVTAVPLRTGEEQANAARLDDALRAPVPCRAAAADYVRRRCAWGRVVAAYRDVLAAPNEPAPEARGACA